jgi:hypothetical protein
MRGFRARDAANVTDREAVKPYITGVAGPLEKKRCVIFWPLAF